MELVTLKSGNFSKAKKHIKSFFMGEAPLLALILQSHRGPGHHERSPWYGVGRSAGAAFMLEEMRLAFGARLRSIAFIKSGWIEARETFKRLVGGGGAGLPPSEGTKIGGPKQVGMPKGGARPAQAGWKPVAVFWNAASAKRDHKAALIEFGQPALQKAFEEETKSMLEWIKDKEIEEGRKLGIKIVGS